MQAKSLIRGTQRRQLSSPNRSSLGKAEAKQQLRGKSPSDVFCFCQFYPFLNSLFFACYKIPSSSFSNPTLNQTQLHNLLHFSHQPSSLLFQTFSFPFFKWKLWGANLASSMALTGILAMHRGRGISIKLQNITHIPISSKHKREFGMDFESDWTRHRKSSPFAAQVIRSATSFMPWSCRIPISEGYHEFL